MNWHEDVPLTRQAGLVIQKIFQYLSDLTSRLLQALTAHFHPLLPMNIPDRKVAPKPDTQFHKSTSISCHPMAAERGLVLWNPDLIRKRWISKKKTSKTKQQKSLKIVIFRRIFGQTVRKGEKSRKLQ